MGARASISKHLLRMVGLVLLTITARATAQPNPNIDAMLTDALMHAQQNRERWRDFRFERNVLRRQFDAEGDETFRQEMKFQVTPTASGWDEELLEIDGRAPTKKEVRAHRKAGRFANQYTQSKEAAIEIPFLEDLQLLPLLTDQEHYHEGLTEIDGISCHQIRFDAREEDSRLSARERLKRALKGSLCLREGDHRLVHAEFESERSVSQWPARVNSMRIVFDARPVEDVVLLERFELSSDIQIMRKRIITGNKYYLTAYERAR